MSGQTGRAGLTAGRQRRLRFIRSAAETHTSAECVNRRLGPGLASTYCGGPPPPPPPPTSPLFFSLFNPPPTPSRPSSSAPHPQLAAEDGFSESSWDRDQREITATSMQNVMWKPPSYVPTIDSSPSTSIPMLSVILFSSFLCLYFIGAQCEIRRGKSPPKTFYR